MLGVTLLGIAAMAGPSVVGGGWSPDGGGADHERVTLAALPDDAPEKGLVYEGLKPAAADSLCAGTYELDEQTCTHGPDAVPAGLKARRDVAPVAGKSPEPAAPRRDTGDVPTDAEIVRDEGGSALTPDAPALVPDMAPGEADFVMGNHDVACEGDGRNGKRVQVLYLHEFGTPSRYSDFLGSMRVWAAGADRIFDASAAETGGSRHLRFVTTPQCRVDVAEVQVPEDALSTFRRNIDALQTLGYNRTDRKYLIFADTNVYCGIGTFVADNRPGLGNRNNGGPSYGRVDAGCWSSAMAAHELTHTLGAVLRDSPNSTGAGSCTDAYDLLCGPDRSQTAARSVCPKKHQVRLDCGHDDYFSTAPPPGSYLATHWNVAASEFLLKSDGGEDLPGVPATTGAAPAPSAATSATPTASATSDAEPGAEPEAETVEADSSPAGPTPSAGQKPGQSGPGQSGPGDSGPGESGPGESGPGESGPGGEQPAEAGTRAASPATRDASAHRAETAVAPVAAAKVEAVLEVRDPTSTAVRLRWSAAAPDARYDVSVDGEPVATTVATQAQLIGLRPDASYRVVIRHAASGYAATATARSAPAARPTQNSWFVLTNSLTGDAADLYAARTTNGTPVVLNGADGNAQQQWRLVPAGKQTFTLQSQATRKCVQPLDGNPVAGTPLVQGDCSSDDQQRWSLQASDHGFTLHAAGSDLVLGVGSQRYGAHRLLTLQPGNGSRQQSWTAVPN
ncbi:RICIN domain-containing protein [Mangrovihabitans endophyticus]|uniref:Ricin B lectin domain-containing protein n=1 Tax=Mangrovihabitans endophyticus TaxID=1751298 RepID=A0A8J3BZ73_9ACTN|nr:RICIN domain-containing protein [Mangrovihabitans endophyticus]GGK85521.1 hypothetical protein GCM10012284_19690 [Mangrovihabitans endophyticus]